MSLFKAQIIDEFFTTSSSCFEKQNMDGTKNLIKKAAYALLKLNYLLVALLLFLKSQSTSLYHF